MAEAIPTKSKSKSSRLPFRPSPIIKLYADPKPSLAFGFVLDDDCRLRWARYFLDECEKDEDESTKLTPEQFHQRRRSLMRVVNSTLPPHIYSILPDLPRLRRALVPVDNGKGPWDRWVFALRDNSTLKHWNSPLTMEHIDAVRNALRLPDDQEPKWFRIDTYVRRGLSHDPPTLPT